MPDVLPEKDDMQVARAEDMKKRAKDEFQEWAEKYDRSLLHRFLFQPSYLVTMEEIALWHKDHPRPFRTLDIGCGTGQVPALIAASRWETESVGMDYAPAMCRQAAQRSSELHHAETARFVAGDSEHLLFADNSFDIVTCMNSFHHYPNQAEAVKEMHRVLRPEGRLILIDGFRDNIIGWVVFDIIIGHVEGEIYHAPWHVMDGYFKDAGFVEIHRRKINVLFPILVTVGMKQGESMS